MTNRLEGYVFITPDGNVSTMLNANEENAWNDASWHYARNVAHRSCLYVEDDLKAAKEIGYKIHFARIVLCAPHGPDTPRSTLAFAKRDYINPLNHEQVR